MATNHFYKVEFYELETLPLGEEYFTENKNKVVRVSADEISLVSPQGGWSFHPKQGFYDC